MRLRDERLKRSLLRALADEQSSRILASTAVRPMSVMDIVREEGIPSTSAYRRVSQLKDAGLLGVHRTVLTREGKKYELYKSTFREVNIAFLRGDLTIEATPNRDIYERAFRLFQSIKEEES